MDLGTLLLVGGLLWVLVAFLRVEGSRSRMTKLEQEDAIFGKNSTLSQQTKDYFWRRYYYGANAPCRAILFAVLALGIALVSKHFGIHV